MHQCMLPSSIIFTAAIVIFQDTVHVLFSITCVYVVVSFKMTIPEQFLAGVIVCNPFGGGTVKMMRGTIMKWARRKFV